MKKVLLAALCLLFVPMLWAQEEKKDFTPKEGDLGIVFNISGLISNIAVEPVKSPMGVSQILGRYYVRDNHALRLGLGIKSYNNSFSFVDSVGSSRAATDSTYKQFNFYFSPGYEYHFEPFKRLDAYIGGGLEFGLIGKTKEQIDVQITDTTGTDKQQTTYTRDGGFQFGISGIIGFNYFIAPKLALGLEYNLGYYWAREGGDWERVTVTTPVSGASRSKRDIGTERTVNSGFDYSNNLSINISYYFGSSKKSKAPPGS